MRSGNVEVALPSEAVKGASRDQRARLLGNASILTRAKEQSENSLCIFGTGY